MLVVESTFDGAPGRAFGVLAGDDLGSLTTLRAQLALLGEAEGVSVVGGILAVEEGLLGDVTGLHHNIF